MPTEKNPIFVLNGPNLDLLGTREPAMYGTRTLKDLEDYCRAEASALGFQLSFAQSNAEHELIGLIHQARMSAGIVINAAAYSYSSYAIVDALRACAVPIIEVHLTNIHARDEKWRANSLVSPVAHGVISGLGIEGYAAAIRAIRAIAARYPA